MLRLKKRRQSPSSIDRQLRMRARRFAAIHPAARSRCTGPPFQNPRHAENIPPENMRDAARAPTQSRRNRSSIVRRKYPALLLGLLLAPFQPGQRRLQLRLRRALILAPPLAPEINGRVMHAQRERGAVFGGCARAKIFIRERVEMKDLIARALP